MMRAVPSILVVDDEEPIRRYVERVLISAGYRVTLAVDCADAIAAAGCERFDLLLTDVVMPDMTGAALAVRLREIDPDLKVLYLTGHADRLFDEKVALCEEEAFLEKPCKPIALQQAVSLAITGRLNSSPVLAAAG
jgi:two-component system cell cycle sensor histidine kinase/response regulator CckA